MMHTFSTNGGRRFSLLAWSAAVTLIFLLAQVQAQEPLRNREPTASSRQPVRLGYTRPGYPEDKTKSGKILPMSGWAREFKGKIIGGTVYFMVLDRKGMAGDTWGTGLGNFDARFIEGRNFSNGYSPILDTQARYLYLYQVVNDRGLDPVPGGIVFAAAAPEIPTVDIGMAEVKLIVDPRYITSWGYFKNTAFAGMVPDRDANAEIRPAAAGESTNIRLACSSNPSILNELPEKTYQPRSPAYSLGSLQDTFGVGLGNLNLKNSFGWQQLEKKKNLKTVALVSWENNMLDSAIAAKDPDFAQIMTGTNLERGLPGLGGETMGSAVFRVDFRAKNLLKLGHHSTIFGFTSDLPPTDEPVLIKEAPAAAQKGKGIRPVAEGAEGEGIVPAAAPGTVPTPAPPAAVGAGTSLAPIAAPMGSLGGQPGGGGGGLGGGFGGLGGGGVGGVAPPTGGGGGIAGGTGGGEGTTQGTGTQQQEQTPGSNPIDFNATLTNQQSQSQSQNQSQTQTQTCCCPGDGGVIPAPGAIILGLLGLPAFWLIRKQRTKDKEQRAKSKEQRTKSKN